MSLHSCFNLPVNLARISFAFICLVCSITSENFNPGSQSQNLGQAFEFKIHVEAGKEDCYYQHIEPDSSLYVAFHVIRGSHSEAGFYINNPDGQTVMPYTWKQSAEFDETTVTRGGYYTMCIDNKPSSYASVLVSMYLASFKRNQWESYVKELSDADLTMANSTNLLRNVDENINSMMNYLEHSKQQHSYDWYLVESNNRYVQNWSMVQCVVIIIAGLVQVYFVRKLFNIDSKGAQSFRGRA